MKIFVVLAAVVAAQASVTFVRPGLGYANLGYANLGYTNLVNNYGYAAAPVAVAAPAAVATTGSSQEHVQDELGQYSYGYSSPTSAKKETKTADGVVRGSYTTANADGTKNTVNYVADALGYRVLENVNAMPALALVRRKRSMACAECALGMSRNLAVPAIGTAYAHHAIAQPVAALGYAAHVARPLATVGYAAHVARPLATVGYAAKVARPLAAVGYAAHVARPLATVGYAAHVARPLAAVGFAAKVARPLAAVGYAAHVARPLAAVGFAAKVARPLAAVGYAAQVAHPVAAFGYAAKPVAIATPSVTVEKHVTVARPVTSTVALKHGIAPEAVAGPTVTVKASLPSRPVVSTYRAATPLRGELRPVAHYENPPVAVTVGHQAVVAPAARLAYNAGHLAAVAAPVAHTAVAYHAAPVAAVAAPLAHTAVAYHAAPVAHTAVAYHAAPVAAVAAPLAHTAVAYHAAPVAHTAVAYHAAPVAAVATPVAVATSKVSAQHHAQDELGQYDYGYEGPTSAKKEIKTADGIVHGSYAYIDANGVKQKVKYVADALGYRVQATNLPVARAAVALPLAVHDTPAVALAKRQHLLAHAAAAKLALEG